MAETKAKHTKLPWHVYQGGNFTGVAPEGYDEVVNATHCLGGAICGMDDWTGENHDPDAPHVRANAELIVKAVNNHDALVEALQAILDLDKGGYLHRDKLDTDGEFKRARKLLTGLNKSR